jgi:hypothetical protein
VSVDQPCDSVELRVVATGGIAMPARPESGETIRHFIGIRLSPDVPFEAEFTVPKLAKPYWLRCFVVQPGGIRVIDPIDEMKVS